MSWVDLLNLAVDIKQSYDIERVSKKLSELEAGAHIDAFMKEILSEIKNFVFRTGQYAKYLIDNVEEYPQAVFIAAKAIENEFNEYNITPDIFPEFVDKEYVSAVREELNIVIGIAQNKLSESEVSEATECLEAINNLPLLDQAIPFRQALEKWNASKDEWKELSSQKQKYSTLGLVFLFLSPILFVLGYIIFGTSGNFTNSDVVCCGPSGLAIISVFLALYFYSRTVPGWRELRDKRKKWQEEKPTTDIIEEINSRFPDMDSNSLINKKDEWNELISRLLSNIEQIDQTNLLTD